MIKVCSHDQHERSKTLTFAIQSEVPMKQYFSVTCFSSTETKSRYSIIPLAVADIK